MSVKLTDKKCTHIIKIWKKALTRRICEDYAFINCIPFILDTQKYKNKISYFIEK